MMRWLVAVLRNGRIPTALLLLTLIGLALPAFLAAIEGPQITWTTPVLPQMVHESKDWTISNTRCNTAGRDVLVTVAFQVIAVETGRVIPLPDMTRTVVIPPGCVTITGFVLAVPATLPPGRYQTVSVAQVSGRWRVHTVILRSTETTVTP